MEAFLYGSWAPPTKDGGEVFLVGAELTGKFSTPVRSASRQLRDHLREGGLGEAWVSSGF